jgi:electron transfer flavoprotein beta subunit
MDATSESLRCERQAEYGYDTVQITLPAVISVGDAINEPRYPSLKAIMGAKKKPLETLGVADVEIDAAKVGGENSAAQWVAAKAPPQKAAGEIIEDEDTAETVEKIIAWLDQRKLL